jgi:hypothetical protein
MLQLGGLSLTYQWVGTKHWKLAEVMESQYGKKVGGAEGVGLLVRGSDHWFTMRQWQALAIPLGIKRIHLQSYNSC